MEVTRTAVVIGREALSGGGMGAVAPMANQVLAWADLLRVRGLGLKKPHLRALLNLAPVEAL